MKSLLIACALMLAGTNAFAWACNLQSCSATINGDTGHTSKKCTASSAACNCVTAVPSNCDGTIATTCPAGWTNFGNVMNGQKCCYGNCVKGNEPAPVAEEIQSNDSNQFDKVFDADMENRTTTYFGYVDGVSRSPNAGRANSIQARLDACLHYVDVDAITGADNSEKWTNCYGSQGCGTTLKNEYCNATGTNNGTSMAAAVCKDRCDCLFGFGTCESL
jgi:hypothetical protein